MGGLISMCKPEGKGESYACGESIFGNKKTNPKAIFLDENFELA